MVSLAFFDFCGYAPSQCVKRSCIIVATWSFDLLSSFSLRMAVSAVIASANFVGSGKSSGAPCVLDLQCALEFLHILQISQSSHFGKCVQRLCLF